MGERLRPVCDFLEGFDISAAMLKKAEAKGDLRPADEGRPAELLAAGGRGRSRHRGRRLHVFRGAGRHIRAISPPGWRRTVSSPSPSRSMTGQSRFSCRIRAATSTRAPMSNASCKAPASRWFRSMRRPSGKMPRGRWRGWSWSPRRLNQVSRSRFVRIFAWRRETPQAPAQIELFTSISRCSETCRGHRRRAGRPACPGCIPVPAR